MDYVVDKETGLYFKCFLAGPVLNLSTNDGIEQEMRSYTDHQYVGFGTHEQYFYPEYFNYQPDYGEKFHKACKVLSESGHEYCFIEDAVK